MRRGTLPGFAVMQDEAAREVIDASHEPLETDIGRRGLLRVGEEQIGGALTRDAAVEGLGQVRAG
jgi:hypothetical protein